MNTRIIGIIILVVAIGGASAYFITKNDPVETNSFLTQPISQNEKISLVINTINPPQSIDDLENAYKVASTSGAGRTNLYVHWSQIEPEKGNFDWRVTDIMMKLNEKYNLRGWGRYLDTKLQLTIDTIELSKELEGTGVTCNAIHPGFVNTNLGRQFTPKFMQPMNKLLGLFILSPQGGADPIIKAACSEEYENITGKYFHRFKQKEASKKVFDKNVSSKLMEYTKNITKI